MDQFLAKYSTVTGFRTIVWPPEVLPDGRRSPLALWFDGSLRPEAMQLPTLPLVVAPLLWLHVPTPFQSIFFLYEAAIRKARSLRTQGFHNIHIIVIDIYRGLEASLYSASAIAKAMVNDNLHLLHEDKLRNYEHEYLIHGVIDRNRILATIPAGGPTEESEVHLGRIGLPLGVYSNLRDPDKESMVQHMKHLIRQSLEARFGAADQVMIDQVFRAFLLRRYD